MGAGSQFAAQTRDDVPATRSSPGTPEAARKKRRRENPPSNRRERASRRVCARSLPLGVTLKRQGWPDGTWSMTELLSSTLKFLIRKVASDGTYQAKPGHSFCQVLLAALSQRCRTSLEGCTIQVS